MPPLDFPDAVKVVGDHLRGQLAAHGRPVPVVTRVPDTRPAAFVRLERVGGTRRDRVTDSPRLDVHCWGADEGDAADLARLARALLFAVPGWIGATAYDVAEVGGPNTSPDPVSGQARVLFALEIHLRGTALTAP